MIRSNQQSLRFPMNQHILPPKKLRLVTKLLGYDFEIQYKTGIANRVANGIVKKRDGGGGRIMCYISDPMVGFGCYLEGEKEDSILRDIMAKIEQSIAVREGYTVHNDLLFFHDRLVIPKPSIWIESLLHEFHDSLIGAYSEFFRTFKRLSNNVFSHGIKKIQNYVAGCEICQKLKYEALSTAELFTATTDSDSCLGRRVHGFCVWTS